MQEKKTRPERPEAGAFIHHSWQSSALIVLVMVVLLLIILPLILPLVLLISRLLIPTSPMRPPDAAGKGQDEGKGCEEKKLFHIGLLRQGNDTSRLLLYGRQHCRDRQPRWLREAVYAFFSADTNRSDREFTQCRVSFGVN